MYTTDASLVFMIKYTSIENTLIIKFRMKNDIDSNVLCLRLNPLDALRSKRCKLVFIQIYTFSPIIGNANHPS